MNNLGKLVILCSIIIEFITGCKRIDNNGKDSLSQSNLIEIKWELDSRCVLPRGQENSFDSEVVGDPCIVWDKDINTWRMFYFAAGKDSSGNSSANTGMAISKSAEEIEPGDWQKVGEITFSNPEALLNLRGHHKFWVMMNPYKNNEAATVKGKYWGIFTCSTPAKYLQMASADKLSGPWVIKEKPVLAPDDNFLDGKHCDTPTAYWFEDKNYAVIFYKGYPKYSQEESQPNSHFGSGTIIAYWTPEDSIATKINVIQRPGQVLAWNQGWMSTPMIFYDEQTKKWYGLINGSPTPPVNLSHREPSPSLGGWVYCSGDWIDAQWYPDTLYSPFLYPEDLSEDELDAGLGVNFWRHHLLVTPRGKLRIFFNSGDYGHEQMYSFIGER